MAINAVFYENTIPQGTGVLAIQGDEGETGLFIPLQSTSITGTFHGPVGSLILTQTFRFASKAMDHPIEAIYRFPLPGDAAVTDVVATFGDETVGTRLAEKEAAEKEYDEAFRSGKKAVLVTRESPDVFTLHLTGIPPETDVVVQTTVTLLARAVPKGWELRLPVTIGPRYVRSDEDHPGIQANPLISVTDPGYRVSLDLCLLPAAEVTVVPPGASITRTADGTRIQLVDSKPDRDLTVRWAAATDGWLTAWSADDVDREFTYLLSLVTPKGEASGPRIPREVILVADQSGSMSGSKWEAAAASIRSFLDGLGPDEFFNLGIFSMEALWFSTRGPVPATREAIASAKTFMEQTSLFGGTELGVALEQALRQPRQPGTYSRHVLVITDGEVTDEARLLRLVEGRTAAASLRRVSVIAIDTAPNSYLALELSRLGGGVAKFLIDTEGSANDIGVTLRDLLASWQAPVLSDAVLTAGRPGLEVADYLVVGRPGQPAADIGDLRPETPVFVVARVPFSPAAPVLTLATHGGEAVAKAPAQPGGGDFATALKVVFGASRIRTLEYLESAGYDEDEVRRRLGEIGYALPAQESALYFENRSEAFRSQLERLVVEESLRFGVPSTHTAFVGVSESAGEAPRVTVAVPNAMPAGWDMAVNNLTLCAPSIPSRPAGGVILNALDASVDYSDRMVSAPSSPALSGGPRYSLQPIPTPLARVPETFDVGRLLDEAQRSAGRSQPKTRSWTIPSFDAAHGFTPLFRPYRIRKGLYVLVVVFPEGASTFDVSVTVRLDGKEIAYWNASESDGDLHQLVLPFQVQQAGLLEALAIDPQNEWHRRPLTVFVRRGWTKR